MVSYWSESRIFRKWFYFYNQRALSYLIYVFAIPPEGNRLNFLKVSLILLKRAWIFQSLPICSILSAPEHSKNLRFFSISTFPSSSDNDDVQRLIHGPVWSGLNFHSFPSLGFHIKTNLILPLNWNFNLRG